MHCMWSNACNWEAMHATSCVTQGWGILTVGSFNSELKLPCEPSPGFHISSVCCRWLYFREGIRKNCCYFTLLLRCRGFWTSSRGECWLSGAVAKKTLLLVHTGFTLVIHGVIISMDVAITRDYGQTYAALQVTWIQGPELLNRSWYL